MLEKNNEEAREILKRLKILESPKEEDSVIDTEVHQKNEPNRFKSFLIGIFGIATVGIVGYQGFNTFQENSQQEVKSTTLLKSNEVKNRTKKEELPITKVEEITPIQTESHTIAEKKVETIIEPIPKKSPIIEEKIAVESKAKVVEHQQKIDKTPQQKKTRTIIVKKGDTLASIAEKFYGNPMYFKRIIRANPQIRSKNTQLHIGDKIIVPQLKANQRRRMAIVRKGDTLASLAKKFYGSHDKFQKIIDANYNIKDENSILHLGQKVYLPK